MFKELRKREYELEILEYQLQKIGRSYDGIDGICNWKRYYSPQSDKFNATAFKEKTLNYTSPSSPKSSREGFAMDIEKAKL